jgi:hypothetical protein
MLVVIVGVSLLAFDGGRARSLQTQMQKAADALALAGAAELNRAPGARTRATNAINNLLSNGLAGMDAATITVPTPVFYETLPQGDLYYSTGTLATDDGHARFVAVNLSSVTVNTIFPVSFLSPGSANGFAAGASAVAGGDEVACQYTPMFICNPYETIGMTYDQATSALINASTSQMIALQGAGNSQYGPGNFGWISAPVTGSASGTTCGSGNSIAQQAAQSHPAVCFRNTSINTQPGNIANTDDGLNTRFDLYAKSFNNCNGNSLYPPAPNVRKGYLAQGNACNASAQLPYPAGNATAMGLPLDSNMLNPDGSPNISSTVPVVGNGQWPCADLNLSISNTPTATCGTGNKPCTASLTVTSTSGIYQGMGVQATGMPSGTQVSSVSSATTVTVAYSGKATDMSVVSGAAVAFQGYWTSAHGPAGNGSSMPSGCRAANTASGISRYGVYQYEISNGFVKDASSGGEVGGPMCSTATPDSTRRVLDVAILNCHALESEGYTLNGASNGLPVAAFAKFFLTVPVTSAQGPIMAEYAGIAKPGDSGVSLFIEVQLYR